MPNGIRVDPVADGLVRAVQEGAPKPQDLPFGVVKIVDEDVEVYLLRRFTRDPVGSAKPLSALKREGGAATVDCESHPFGTRPRPAPRPVVPRRTLQEHEDQGSR